MAPNIKKYFIYTAFLVFPLSISLFAQSKIEKPINSIIAIDQVLTIKNLNQSLAPTPAINLDNSKQFIVELSIPKDSFAVVTAGIDKSKPNVPSDKTSKKIITYYSALAKDIIENYKYDFSETFIDILFFEDIDLARIRTI
ncbi:hypothetical protein [Flavobacterium sp. CF136]|uniref:hypothetical protein n=1 Tax=Flavobacterium sp. (strain CF136) TaxID=1144313 RepID=UPI00027152B3|nr:hypothetical protein [Flavobacterium sp. CF136]EJL62898.1 hypothetical protein PMI10_02523 [Flavobacterium sp. CF136]